MKNRTTGFLEAELIGEDLAATANQPELSIVRNLGFALRRGAVWIAAVGFAGAVLAFLLSSMADRKYTSVAQVMIDTRVSVETEFAPIVSGLPTSATTLESELEVLRSLDLIEVLVDTFDLMDDPEFSAPLDPDAAGPAVAAAPDAATEQVRREQTIAAVAGQAEIEQLGAISAVYAITFTTTDPVKSARLANALAQAYLDTTTAAKLRSLELSQGWLTDRTVELQARLTNLSVELGEHLLAAPHSIEEVETLKAKSLALERQLDRLGEDQTDRVAQIEAELAAMRAVLNSQARHDAVAQRIENDIAVSEAIYQDFMTQLSRRTQQEGFLDADARVIALARPALDPSEPKRKQATVLGAILAGFAATLVIMGAELTRNQLRTVREYEEVTGLPLIGIIPEVPRAEAKEGMGLFVDAPVLQSAAMRFPRKIMASILAMSQPAAGARPRRGFSEIAADSTRIIAGVSANRDEGLTQTMFMLAVSFAEAGERVLLVDLDFWTSPYPESYSDPGGKARAPLNPDARRQPVVKTGRPLLDLLPAAQVDPSRGAPVTADGLGQILDQMAETYDRILLDLPPLMWRPDAATLCRAADITLVIARWNATPRAAISSTLKLLEDVGVTPQATVATRLKTADMRKFGENSLYFPKQATASEA